MKRFLQLSFALCLIVAISTVTNSPYLIYPVPNSMSLEQIPYTLSTSCLKLSLESENIYLDTNNKLTQTDFSYYLNKIQKRYQNQHKCHAFIYSQENKLEIIIKQNLQIVTHQEGYKIVSEGPICTIYIREYAGYVYAMETLSQIISRNGVMKGVIEDSPQVSYRGIMIDSVRHFINAQYIKKLIPAMPLAKLNMLHWHLSDDEAFVLQLVTHPELAKSGAYDAKSYYTLEQMKSFIALAQKNGVNIIPEFDTPAHIRSWGLDDKWKNTNITILCPGGQHYNHQFDLSKESVFKLAEQVIKQIDNIFIKSPYLHLGGDQTSSACWNLRPSIQTFMKLKNIKNYDELQMYWRYELKQTIPSSRKVIFWRVRSENIVTGPEDILQYWGNQNQTAQVIGSSQSKVILSPSDILYLNEGQSFIWQNQTFGKYFTWLNIYQNFTVFPQGVNKERILGAEACLWGQVSNEDTFQNNLWPRIGAFGFKLWSDSVMSTAQLISALVSLRSVLSSQKIQCSPIVSQFCEKSPEKCYPEASSIFKQ